MTDNIIFECDTNIDCVEDKETIEIINGKPVIVKSNEEVVSLES
jgi:uncharacterized protein YlzI (FlbEa/FlbD family)